MPEGPEIHIQADSIRKAVGGETCRYIYFHHEHLKPFERELSGKTITSVEAYGKGIVISFEGDTHIFSHNQLYGKWYVKDAGQYPKTGRSLRLEIQSDQKSALLYSASDIDVMDADSLNSHPYLSRIGPDILRCDDPGELVSRSLDKRFRNRSFGALLLDQHFIAGIGNYLRSEILFHAGIHPSKKPSDLSESGLERFAESALVISNRSYRTKGITLDDKRVEELKKEGKKRRDYRYYVFSRDGKKCHICGTVIEKRSIGGRRLYICNSCQPG